MSLLTDEFLSKYDNSKVQWGFGGVGLITYKRTYARTKADGTLEDWTDTIKRCINGAQDIGANYTQDEAERLFHYMFHLKALFGGRFLWQLGTETVKRYGKSSLVNCWFVPVDSIDSFCFTFDMLN